MGTLEKEFEEEWLVWRIIKESNYQISREQIETEWSLDDVFKVNALLDMEQDYQTADSGLQAMKQDKTNK
ncbi:MAG: hypothetical protein ACTSRU_15920 [Candidatus Hodarchaeales archaeon]